MKVALIVPAAGSGERLGLGSPKALATVSGRSLLAITLAALARGARFVETVVLAPAGLAAELRRAAGEISPDLGAFEVIEGGATRQRSVAAGLAALGRAADLVCIHDAARPLVAAPTIAAVLEAAALRGAATAASRPSDSVRQDLGGGDSVALDRSRLWLVETPQAFRRDLLIRAHAEAGSGEFTDDASIVEATGQKIQVVASQGRNLKVTVASDLVLVREALEGQGRMAANR